MVGSCSNISLIPDPIEKCAFAKANCQLDSILPYASFTYCELPSTLPRIAVLSVLLLLNFGIMGVAAFDYLSPNLTHLAEISGLSQSLMGVTVLAFGNGSVDVFGALVALNHGEGGMAFGEIMGGALFVCSVVIGSMAIIQPFEIEPHFALRDVAILGISIVFTLGILSDGVITLAESLMGLCMYSMYAIFVVHQQWTQHKQPHEAIVVSPEAPQDEEAQSYLASPTSINLSDPPFTPLRQSLYSAVDTVWMVHQHMDELTSRTPPPLSPQNDVTDVQPHRVHMRRRSSAPTLASSMDSTATVPQMPALLVNAPSDAPNSSSSRRLLSPHDLPKLRTGISPSGKAVDDSYLAEWGAVPREVSANEAARRLHADDYHDTPREDAEYAGEHEHEQSSRSRHHHRHHHHHHSPHPYGQHSMQHLVAELLEGHKQIKSMSPMFRSRQGSADSRTIREAASRTASDADSTGSASSTSETSSCASAPEDYWLYHLCPSFYDWKNYTWFHRVHLTLTFPVITLLNCSVPLSLGADSRVRVCIHAVGVPFLLPVIAPSVSYSHELLLAQVICAAAGIIWWGKLRRPLPSSFTVALIGFMMSLLWVLLLTKELVSLLIVSGVVCHISETVMGLTVFALGDSLGDLVSNLTVARIGFSTMAISACFGGPIFTMLVGISGASLFTMLTQRRMQLEIPVTSSLLLSSFGLLFVLAFFVVSVIRNRFIATKALGVQLICIWFVVVAGSMIFSGTLI